MAYRGHYIYDYISPESLDCTTVAKTKQPIYADIEINDDWLEHATVNDTCLCSGLVQQVRSSDSNVNMQQHEIEDSVDNVCSSSIQSKDIDVIQGM